MKTGTSVLALVSLTLISTWGLSGCSKTESATTTKTDTREDLAEKGGEHAQHGEAETTGPEERGRHQHKHDGHRKGGHKHHDHGERHRDETAPEGKVKVGDNVPDLSVRTLDGRSIELSELQADESRTRTGVVVLSFWCTTCHSCREMEHQLAKLYQDYKGRAAVIALAANSDETAESVTAFLKENGLELPVVLDPDGNTADLFGVSQTTTTVVIDGNGVLRYCGRFGEKNGGSAEAALKAVLAGEEVAVKTTPHFG